MTNVIEARDFLTWRNGKTDDIALSDETVATLIKKRKVAYDGYKELTVSKQKEVLDMLDDHNKFESVVDLVLGDIVW